MLFRQFCTVFGRFCQLRAVRAVLAKLQIETSCLVWGKLKTKISSTGWMHQCHTGPCGCCNSTVPLNIHTGCLVFSAPSIGFLACAIGSKLQVSTR